MLQTIMHDFNITMIYKKNGFCNLFFLLISKKKCSVMVVMEKILLLCHHKSPWKNTTCKNGYQYMCIINKKPKVIKVVIPFLH
jgi:hypothetical protein